MEKSIKITITISEDEKTINIDRIAIGLTVFEQLGICEWLRAKIIQNLITQDDIETKPPLP